jgi:pyruvate/2-oxoacid:ferredoxin oxidoreductase alpha subunit
MSNFEILNEQGEVVTTIVADEAFVKEHYAHYRERIDLPPPPPLNAQQKSARQYAYQQEADPIFFLMQRGEATQEEWQAKINEIKERYPYYYDDEGNLLEAQE